MYSAWSNVRGFVRLSFCDWPGRNVCVLFMGGCSLKCPTCHNGDIAWSPESFPCAERTSIERYIRSKKRWLDGIVISGGEPLETKGFAAMLRDMSELDLPIKIDTNGMRPHLVEALLHDGLADAFFVDVKGPYHKYPALTGNQVTPAEAKANLEHLFFLAERSPQSFVFRQTGVPILTQDDVIESRSYLPQGFSLTMQKYVPPRRLHAKANPETRRMPGNVVSGSHRPGHTQGAEDQRSQGSFAGEAACA